MSSDYDVIVLGGPAGEWLRQATLAIRTRVPIAIARDTIQPFPTFSEAFLYALEELGKPTAMAMAEAA